MKAQDKNRAKGQKGKMKNVIKVFLKESFRVRALEWRVCARSGIYVPLCEKAGKLFC